MKIFYTSIKLLLAFLIVGFYSHCNIAPKHKGYTVTGTFNNAENQIVYLEELAPEKAIVIDTGVIDDEGKLQLQGYISEPGIYRLNIDKEGSILLILENEEIEVIADVNDLKNYEINNSPGSTQLKLLMAQLESSGKELEQLTKSYQSTIAQDSENDSLIKVIENQYKVKIAEFKSHTNAVIDSPAHPLILVFASGTLNPEQDYDKLQQIKNTLNKEIPNSKYTKDFDKKVNKSKPLRVGDVAPNINLPGPNGNNLELSSLKGNIVLLDFWASWCKPCRVENPNIVALYNKYNKEGFTIYSVSLDKNKDQWLKAIAEDHLLWENHVSELKAWDTEGIKAYQINSIPTTYLLDTNGVIVGKNLRGRELENVISEQLNKESNTL